MHILYGYRRASFLLLAFLPVWGIAFLGMTADSGAVFDYKLAHGMETLAVVLLAGFLGFAASRSYLMELDVSLRYFSLAYFGFAFLYSIHGLLTPVADEHSLLFLSFGPMSRLAMCIYSYLGLRSLLAKRPPEFRKKSSSWWYRHYALWAACVLLTGAAAESGLLSLPVIKSAEALALGVAALAAIRLVILRSRSSLLRYHLFAQLVLAQASLSFLLSSSWNPLWWFSHAVSASGFLILGYALARSYKETRSIGRVYNETLLYPALRSVLRTTHEGFVLTDNLGRINYANPRMELFFQEKPAPGQLITSYLSRLGLRTFQPESIAGIAGSLLSGAADSIDLNIEAPRADNDPAYYEFYAAPVLDELGGQRTGFLFVFRNRSEEERLNRMKDDFISIVSHELRTPMSAIQGFTEILLEREVPMEKRMRYLETIHSEVVRLSALVDDFLDIQRMESGRQTYHFEPLDLTALVAEVAEQWQGAEKHTLRVDLPAHGSYIRGDRERMIQILHNLISNAVKYSPGKDAVDVALSREGSQAVIRVRDYGLGIPEESLPRLFQKFYRVETSDHRKIRGTGLGLSIVRGIVDSHGGEIRVKAAPEGGTEFTVLLPAYDPPELKGRVAVLEESDESRQLFGSAAYQSAEWLRMVSREELRFALSHSGTLPKLWVTHIRLEERRDGWSLLRELLGEKHYKDKPLVITVAGGAQGTPDQREPPAADKDADRILGIIRELMKRPEEGQLLAVCYDDEAMLQLLHKQGIEIAGIERASGITSFAIWSQPQDSEDTAS